MLTAMVMAAEKPNIVILFADDLGITDIGCYGKEHGNTYHETPNIDLLAQQGMLFTDAYAASPVCSPTRAGILTGKYPARLRLTDFLPGQLQPQFKNLITAQPEQQFLPPKEVTFAQALKEGGYSTWFLVNGILARAHHQTLALNYNSEPRPTNTSASSPSKNRRT